MTVVEEDEEGISVIDRKHPLPKLWRRPNPYYSGTLMWYGVLASYIIDGNGYVLKIRNDSGRVVQLWWVPHSIITPRWASRNSFIDWYDYYVDGQRIPIAVDDVFHLRYGMDPSNIRLGRSPLRTLMQELGVDQEAGAFTASILKNAGVPGVVIAPDKELRGTLDEPKRLAIKAEFKQQFGGENRGDPIIMSKPSNITQFGFSPQELVLDKIRNIPEERVCAVLGMPIGIVGFQQENSSVGATRAEDRDQAYENCIIPTHTLVGDEVDVQMLPEFATSMQQLDRQSTVFDISKLPVLLDAQQKRAEIQSTRARAGIAKRKEVRADAGLPIGPDDDVYIPAPGVQLIDEKGKIIGELPGPGQRSQQPSGEAAIQAAAKSLKEEFERRLEERDDKFLAGMKGIVGEMTQMVNLALSVKSQPSSNGHSGAIRFLRNPDGTLAGIAREDGN